MPIDQDQYQKLQKAAEVAKNDHARAQGQLESSMQNLADNFECDTIEEAEALAERLTKKAAKLEKAYEEKRDAFEKKWEDRLQ